MILPILDQRFSVGPGQKFLETADVGGKLSVLESTIREYSQDKLKVVEVREDSMTGIHLFDGDLAIFASGVIRGDGIYVISLDGEAMVKWLEFDPATQKVSIISENPRYPAPKVISRDGDILRVEGKVIGWYHNHLY